MPVEYPFRNYLFLFGASAKAEVVNYVRTQCVPEEEQRLGDTLAAWVGANKHFREVEQAEIGEPEQIDLREIPEESSAEIKKVESDFLFIVPGARRRPPAIHVIPFSHRLNSSMRPGIPLLGHYFVGCGLVGFSRSAVAGFHTAL